LQALGASASGRPAKVQISCDVGIRLIAVELYPQTHGQDARATSEPAVQKSTALRCDFSVGGPHFSDSIFLTFRAFSGQALVKKMGSKKWGQKNVGRPIDPRESKNQPPYAAISVPVAPIFLTLSF
jgi:hypothetical protein